MFVFIELDATHDRHERITKLDRDIRIESKRIIFLLHRFPMKQDEQAKQGLCLRFISSDLFPFYRTISRCNESNEYFTQ
jgi:hypothetical protein